MSYCRWSSDDYLCDIYAYESENGFQVHVANSRVVYKEPLPEPIIFEGDADAWFVRHRTVSRMFDEADRVDIGLEHDGKNFCYHSAGECGDCLVMLKECGYNVPEYAIDALREEEAENPTP